MPTKRTPKPAAARRGAKKQIANPKQAAELFEEGRQILAARSTAATESDTRAIGAPAPAAESGGAAGESGAAEHDRVTPSTAVTAAGNLRTDIETIMASGDEAVKYALVATVEAYLSCLSQPTAEAKTAAHDAAREELFDVFSDNNVLPPLEGIAATGACYTAFAKFMENAEAGEMLWLATLLSKRLEEPSETLGQVVMNHLAPFFARAYKAAA
jgi:hypothetical protein